MLANPTGTSNTKRLSQVLELVEEIQKNDTGDQDKKAPAASTAPKPIEKTPKLEGELAISSLAAKRMLGKATVTTLCDGNSIL